MTPRHTFMALALIGALALPAHAAHAGTFEGGLYTSNFGYSLIPPEKWKHADGDNIEEAREEMPKPLQEATASTYDVLFFDAALDGDEKESLHDSINIVVVIPPIDPDEDGIANSIGEKLKPEMSKLFESANLADARVRQHGDHKTVDLQWVIEDKGGEMKGEIFQSLLTLEGAGGTLLITCAMGTPRAMNLKKTCSSVIESIKDKPPEGAE